MGALCTLALPWNPPERRGSSPGSSVGTAEVGLCVWGEGTQEVPERHLLVGLGGLFGSLTDVLYQRESRSPLLPTSPLFPTPLLPWVSPITPSAGPSLTRFSVE